MMFVEPHPDLISPNPGGSQDPLGESVMDVSQSWIRVFEPNDVRLVIGRHQDPNRELVTANALADQVPMHRRVSGGGAVVLAPGMVVVALRLLNNEVGTTCYLDRVNSALVPAVAAVCGQQLQCRGHGDLVIGESDGIERKVLGASLRQTSRMVVYLGVFLVSDAIPQMERYLATPSREPTYRGGRGHGAFCTHLGTISVQVNALVDSITSHAERRLGSQALR
jgi:lipoate-protein ligase A